MVYMIVIIYNITSIIIIIVVYMDLYVSSVGLSTHVKRNEVIVTLSWENSKMR